MCYLHEMGGSYDPVMLHGSCAQFLLYYIYYTIVNRYSSKDPWIASFVEEYVVNKLGPHKF